jgi:hypothetical protein
MRGTKDISIHTAICLYVLVLYGKIYCSILLLEDRDLSGKLVLPAFLALREYKPLGL